VSRARGTLGALLLAGGLWLAPPATAQCAMCRATVENSAEGHRLSHELNQAIGVMFVAPYAVFASCTAFLFRRRIRAALRAHLAARRARR
jgi:hypothetical protein